MGIDSISSFQPMGVDVSAEVEVAAPIAEVAVAVPAAPSPTPDAFAPAAPQGVVAAPPEPPALVAEDTPTVRVGLNGGLTTATSVTAITGTGQSIDQTLKPGVVQTIDVTGSHNNVDLSADPVPVVGAQANIILGGAHNQGEFDVQGTIVVKAGDHNTWVLNAAADKTTDEKALPKIVILEGSLSDWAVTSQVKGGERTAATYTNTKTGTTVEVPPGIQVQAEASTAGLEALVKANPASSPTKILEACGFTMPVGEVKAFLDWQRVQDSPITGRRIGDDWATSGTNPYTNAQLITNAKEAIETYKRRTVLLANSSAPLPTAPWLLPGASIAKPRPVAVAGSSNLVVGPGPAPAPYTITGGPGPTPVKATVDQRPPVGYIGKSANDPGRWSSTPATTVAGPGAAPSSSPPSRPSASERLADHVIAQEYPGLGAQTKAALRKLLLSLMKQTGRHGATDVKHMAHSKQATALITAATS